MGIRQHKVLVIVSMVSAFLCGASSASAEIDGFEIRGITAVGDVSLNSRLGTTSSATEHLINIADCEAYQGGEVRVEFGVDTTNYVNYSYGVAVALPGKTCQTDGTDFAGSDDTVCTVINSSGELTSTFDEIIDLDRLSGGVCTDGTEASSVLYLVISDANSANAVSHEVLFNVDLLRPATPSLREVVGGDQRLEVIFDDEYNETEEGLTYNVFWSTESIDDPPGSEVSSDSTSSTSYDIEDGALLNGQTYYVRVNAVDSADNESSLSDELSAEPVPTTDFWESYKAAGGTDPGGFCFIATAAYGSPMAAQLDVLRAFRDQILWPTALGRAFVRDYYVWGRQAALWIEDKPAVRALTRVALTPLVWFAGVTTTVGALPGSLLLLLAMVALMGSIRLWRRRSRETAEVRA